ncbi:unnamed protein product [Camellia sinensis]
MKTIGCAAEEENEKALPCLFQRKEIARREEKRDRSLPSPPSLPPSLPPLPSPPLPSPPLGIGGGSGVGGVLAVVVVVVE